MYRYNSESSEKYGKYIFGICCLSSIIAILGILYFLVYSSLPILGFLIDSNFAIGSNWEPLENQYNIFPMIFGSLLVAMTSIMLLIPWSLGTIKAFYLHTPHSMRPTIRFIFLLMASMPTVVFGFWGLEKLAPFLNQYIEPGTGILCAVFLLTFMTFPSSIVLMMDRFESIPESLKESSMALGLSYRGYFLKVAIPTIKKDFMAIYLLAITRVIGETIAVVMVAGNVVKVPSSLGDSFRTLTANIVLEMPYAMNEHRSSLFFSGLILTLVSFLLVFGSHQLARKTLL